MNYSWLEDFQALAASGNFSRAADQRHMTQPAFSRRIRALEEWLGVALFDRSTQPASLTEPGQWFQSVAKEVIERVERIPGEAKAIAQASSTTLRIASTHALSLHFLPEWLRKREAQTTVGAIQLVSDVLQQCELLMQHRKAQFLLCHTHPHVPNRLDSVHFPSRVVGQDELIPVSTPDRHGHAKHALHGRGKLRIPLLAYSPESGIGRLIRSTQGTALDRLNAHTVFTAHLATVLKSMALDGRGLAWLPKSLIADELAAGRLVSAGGPEWTIAVSISLFRQPSTLPTAAEAFWQALSLQAAEKPSVRAKKRP